MTSWTAAVITTWAPEVGVSATKPAAAATSPSPRVCLGAVPPVVSCDAGSLGGGSPPSMEEATWRRKWSRGVEEEGP